MLDHALSYAANGWRIFPCHWPIAPHDGIECSCGQPAGKGKGLCSSRGKHPKTMHGCHDASADERAIRRWWDRAPYANIGLATGPDNDLFVLDVDPDHGGDLTLAELEKQNGTLPPTLTARTGSGGRHILFKHILGLGNSVGALGAGLDTRSAGGYIIVAPSLHASGNHYEWINDDPIIEAPQWLIDKIIGKGADALPGGGQPGYWARIARGVGEGERHMAVLKLAGLLIGTKRIEPTLALALVRAFNKECCHPSLDEAEVDERVMRVAKRQLSHE